ncbi:SixA phosphatase family protein [Bdellovibrio bacteriovorus]|uniref:Phosphohistidine phosphatase n=1 Tax=Bdellovibrio bacteriovorus str. Tiberius TaxID=1069642 RepID=K7ZEM9_BDEBC|nr:histidine phosphatase family protein [Bdellovibrio bacteriovorus]AFY00657.1 phosphohistidine phosphatase [Bdellovibrio bacteriovorus str. Tiberius]
MELIIIRHAVAEDKEEFAKKGQEDHLRPLTLKGRKRMQKVCVNLRDYVKEIDLIVSSPLTRARQTAEIISQIYFETKVVEAPELVPHSPPQAFLKWLRVQGRNYKRIAIVGHEPHLSVFASYMLSMKAESFIDLKKSGIIGLELESFSSAEAGRAQLLYSIPPKFLAD